MKDAPVFNCDRGQVGVSHQDAGCLSPNGHLTKQCPVIIAGKESVDVRLVKPSIYNFYDFANREARAWQAKIGQYSHEGRNSLPR